MMEKQIQWVSTSRQSYWDTKGVVDTTDVSPNLTLTDAKQRIIDGFGGCFNELGIAALEHLSEEERNAVYDALFSPNGECNFTICRLPIGASDYALEWYS